MTRVRVLPIDGYRGRPVPNVLYEPAERTGHLVLFFPDLRYPTTAPLFHYLRLHYVGTGADVLAVDYEYPRNPRYVRRPDVDKQRWFLADVLAAFQAAALARPSTRLTLVGKSVGTLALAHLALSGKLPERSELVWVTPPLDASSLPETLRDGRYRSLVLLGAKVPAAESQRAVALTASITRNPLVTLRSFEHADEQLERVGGDVADSIDLLRSAVRAVVGFSKANEEQPYWSDQRKS